MDASSTPIPSSKEEQEQEARQRCLEDVHVFINANSTDAINQLRELMKLPIPDNSDFFPSLAEFLKTEKQSVIDDVDHYMKDRPLVEELITPSRQTSEIFKLIDLRQTIRNERNDQEWNFTALDVAFMLTGTVGSSMPIDQLVGGSTDFVDFTQTLARLACPHFPEKGIRKRKAAEMEDELDAGTSTSKETGNFRRVSVHAERVKKRDGFRCNVLGTAKPEAAHLFPFASNTKVEHLKKISQSFPAMLFFQDQRREDLLSRMTHSPKCLDVPANMLCLNYTLHRLMDQGYIALWWKGAVPEVESTTIVDFPFEDKPTVDTPKRVQYGRGQYAKYFTHDAAWIVSVQIQFQFRRGKDVTREIDIAATGEEIFPESQDYHQYSGIDPFLIFKECRLSSGRQLEDGHIFTMRIPFSQLSLMKMMMQLQWYCITSFTMAGGAGLPKQDWEDNISDDDSDCEAPELADETESSGIEDNDPQSPVATKRRNPLDETSKGD